MPSKNSPAAVAADNVRYFRARRTHLVGAGAPTPRECAADILGAQSQVEHFSLHAISARTNGRPTANGLKTAIYERERSLVRTWGQRGTIHLYAAEDWPLVIAARRSWRQIGRRGGMPSEPLIEEAREVFADADRPLVRSDLFDIVPESYLDEIRDHPGVGKDPRRFAATRLVWVLARRGHISFGPKVGSQQSYAHRDLWFPELEFDGIDTERACVALVRRYLSRFAPATAGDIAHYFGTRVGDAKRWVEALRPELSDVACGGRRGLVALTCDLDELARPIDDWPARLMPMYDTMLMTHKDKSWVIDAREERQVWRKAAMVRPCVVFRGRLVATWDQRATSKALSVTIAPLAEWDSAVMPDVERDHRELARHLGLDPGDLDVADA